MKLTEAQLRKIVRSVLSESTSDVESAKRRVVVNALKALKRVSPGEGSAINQMRSKFQRAEGLSPEDRKMYRIAGTLLSALWAGTSGFNDFPVNGFHKKTSREIRRYFTRDLRPAFEKYGDAELGASSDYMGIEDLSVELRRWFVALSDEFKTIEKAKADADAAAQAKADEEAAAAAAAEEEKKKSDRRERRRQARRSIRQAASPSGKKLVDHIKDTTEGNAFRAWARSHAKYGALAKAKRRKKITIDGKRLRGLDLDAEGRHNNLYMARAWKLLGDLYLREKGDSSGGSSGDQPVRTGDGRQVTMIPVHGVPGAGIPIPTDLLRKASKEDSETVDSIRTIATSPIDSARIKGLEQMAASAISNPSGNIAATFNKILNGMKTKDPDLYALAMKNSAIKRAFKPS